MSEVDFSILDGSIDELADLKGFEPLPAGSYKLGLEWKEKAINDMPAVVLTLKVEEVMELADKSLSPPEVGATADIAFILRIKDKQTGEAKRSEIGEGQLKEVVKVLAPTFGGANIRETMAASNGASMLATLKVRANKNDPDQKFNQIKACSLPE